MHSLAYDIKGYTFNCRIKNPHKILYLRVDILGWSYLSELELSIDYSPHEGGAYRRLR